MSLRGRFLVFFLSFLAVTGMAAAASAARAAAAGRLAVTALSFSPASVDATGGTASATLTWTVTDSNASATDIAGEVDIREQGAHPGTYIGMAYPASFDLTGALSGDVSGNGSGTAQKATFSYTFSVPQYANATTAKWVVSAVSLEDDQGASTDINGVTLTGFHAVLDATELADTTAPTYDQLVFANPSQRPFLYDNGTTATITYSLEVLDPESGFWMGRLELSGPHGQHAFGSFAAEYSVTEDLDLCGPNGLGFGTQDITCDVTVDIPANAAAGTWSVSAITLTDNADNTQTYAGLSELPVTVTADKAIRASGFTASPNPVDDWGTFANTTLTMAVTGESGGVTAIYVDGTAGACGQSSTTPTQNADGTYSVPLYMAENNASCTITGIAVVDGAGDVSLYGSEYGAPDPGVTITQVPDTTPPVATAASLTSTSLVYSADSQFDGLTLTIDDQVAPVDEVSVFLYDSSGNGGEVSYGGVQSTLNGTLTVGFSLPAGFAPGTYTVGFELTDVAGLTSFYGTPNGTAVPGGPLTLTITSS